MTTYQQIKEELIKRDGATCSTCGASNIPLEICHIIPLKDGGSNDLDNLALECALCNRSVRELREFEFIQYLSELMQRSPDFKDGNTLVL